MKGVPLIINAYVMLALCFTNLKYVLHALAWLVIAGTIEAQEEPHMDRLHACSFTLNVIARE